MADVSGIRINKFLSEAGVCSRREADRMLADGRVCIDGVMAQAGAKVMPGMEVTVDGRENVLHAYEEAKREKYRFFSFGDAMFLTDSFTKDNK